MSNRNGVSTHKRMPEVALLSGIVLGMILFTMTFTAPAHADTISADIGGEVYDIEYTATGMTVSGVDVDLGLISLILSVDVTDPRAILDITLDRAFFDSVIDGQDYDFIVLSDGDQARFTESQPDSASRILSISLPIGTEEVEIVGTVFGQSAVTSESGQASEQVTDPVLEPVQVQDPVLEPVQVQDPVLEPVQVQDPKSEPEPPEELEQVTDEPKEIIEGTLPTQCGAGTILKDGVCILDERCGEGTVLEDGVCVLAPESTTRAMSGDLAAGSIGGFVIAGFIAVGAIIIVKISRRKHTNP